MKVFLSWSGPASHAIAEKLFKWLPMVIQKIEPYISTEIEKGTRWSSDIAKELEQCSFGIACVTIENREAPWLLFEAGALSKSVSEGKLAPVLFGLEQSDIQKSPLTQFQMTKFEKAEFKKLLQSINESLDGSLADEILGGLFEALWPQLELEINAVLAGVQTRDLLQQTIDPEKIMGAMEELLTNSRAISQTISRPEKILPQDYLDYILRRSERFGYRSSTPLKRIRPLVRAALQSLSDIRSVSDDGTKEMVEKTFSLLAEVQYLLDQERMIPRVMRPPTSILEPADKPVAKATSQDVQSPDVSSNS